MTEQDKATLVPAVLNDLIDVDGEPADGETLRRVGDAWVPSVGQGINDNGPMVFSLSEVRSGLTLGNQSDITAFTSGSTDATQSNFGDYWGPGVDPVPAVPFARKALSPGSGKYGIEVLVPGVYDVTGIVDPLLSSVPTVPAAFLCRLGLPGYYSAAREWVPAVLTGPSGQISVPSVVVNQSDIDNNVNFFELQGTYFPSSGTTYPTQYYLQLDVWQRWPGSPTPTAPAA